MCLKLRHAAVVLVQTESCGTGPDRELWYWSRQRAVVLVQTESCGTGPDRELWYWSRQRPGCNQSEHSRLERH
ncbi:hypothetical protein CesoFtcFv8_010759 [Champsocephalus esox]|uniref:Uncharacterized protein n=1 Tax=Champsocephalus esox TaxID=159716 RepID=A0AAN8GZR3_9TELE|nr:hypothetical protein CesoFtcFv8_010759 [Champsocephalus esox]